MEMLNETEPHFIRCIKPNKNRRPREFDAPMALSQLRFAGVFEAVTIRKSGYPFRMTLQRFVHWYKPLLLPRTSSGYTHTRTFKLAEWESPNQQKQARQILARYDKDGSAQLELAEFRQLVDELRQFQGGGGGGATATGGADTSSASDGAGLMPRLLAFEELLSMMHGFRLVPKQLLQEDVKASVKEMQTTSNVAVALQLE